VSKDLDAGLLGGRVALITGGAAGIGLGIATAMAREGAAVVLAARRIENGEPAAEALRDAGHRALCVRCDVTSRIDLESAVAATIDGFGHLDCFVHNAVGGSVAPGPIEGMDDGWPGLLATTVRASFDAAQVAHPHLAAAGGSFLLLTSAAGMEGSASLPAYAMVKASQRALAKSLSQEWGPAGIRVNCIAPVARTPAMDRAYRANPDLEERLLERTPLRRIGDPTDDIGPVAVFLTSDLARFVTGQTIVADGGGFLGL
jgi:3-oxoacyl-[acyl-carrier protein] reductase|tara:strand:- start:167 stop:943 length:777 start_codon:yes stop_codon:yes gene_type:complete